MYVLGANGTKTLCGLPLRDNGIGGTVTTACPRQAGPSVAFRIEDNGSLQISEIKAFPATWRSLVGDMNAAAEARESAESRLTSLITAQSTVVSTLVEQVNDQSSLISAQSTTASTLAEQIAAQDRLISEQSTTIKAQDKTIAANTDAATEIEKALKTLRAAVVRPKPDGSPQPEAAPEVGADGKGGLSIVNRAGSITFESDKCGERDLCDIALDLAAVKAKFDL